MVGTSPTLNVARGLRNHNPGNIRDYGIKWRGLVGRDADGFCIFDTPHNGLRALALDIVTKFRKPRADRLDTVEEIIEIYAPPNENDTAAYIASVSNMIGAHPKQVINLEDPNTLAQFERAVVMHENGSVPYDASAIMAAVNDALGRSA